MGTLAVNHFANLRISTERDIDRISLFLFICGRKEYYRELLIVYIMFPFRLDLDGKVKGLLISSFTLKCLATFCLLYCGYKLYRDGALESHPRAWSTFAIVCMISGKSLQ